MFYMPLRWVTHRKQSTTYSLNPSSNEVNNGCLLIPHVQGWVGQDPQEDLLHAVVLGGGLRAPAHLVHQLGYYPADRWGGGGYAPLCYGASKSTWLQYD